MCEIFTLKEHDPHRLYIACRGKSCTPDDRYDECHEWSDERCKRVADYVEKLSLQHKRKKERKTKSSSSFSGFSPSMLVPLGWLPSADLGVVTTSASSSAVCAVMFVVAGPAVTTAPVTLTPVVTLAKHPRKRRRVTDPKERELMMLNFEDWWTSRRSVPWPGPSSASQPLLVTPPVVPAPGPSGVPTTVAIPLVVALSTSLQSVASSPCSAKRSHSHRSRGPVYWKFPGPIPGPVTSLEAVFINRTHLPAVPRPVAHPEAVLIHGTGQPAVPGPVLGPITCPEAAPVQGTHLPAIPGPVPGPVTRPEAIPINGTCLPTIPGPVVRLGATPVHGTRPPLTPSRWHCHSSAPARWLGLLTIWCHERLLLRVRLLWCDRGRRMRCLGGCRLHLTCCQCV